MRPATVSTLSTGGVTSCSCSCSCCPSSEGSAHPSKEAFSSGLSSCVSCGSRATAPLSREMKPNAELIMAVGLLSSWGLMYNSRKNEQTRRESGLGTKKFQELQVWLLRCVSRISTKTPTPCKPTYLGKKKSPPA